MQGVIRFYRLINILSLDVVAGAVVSALFFARVFEVKILPYGIAALALTVWIIYTTDHLRDAHRIQSTASSARHQFHQKYFNTLTIAALIAVAMDSVMLFFIRKQVFIWGLWLIGFVGIYLLIERSVYFLKEFFIAIMYTVGVLLLSMAVTLNPVNVFHIGLIVQFFLLALCNLLIFSCYDVEIDRKDNLSSFVTAFGVQFTRRVVLFLMISFAVINISTILFSNYQVYGSIFSLMMIMLMIIFFARNRFSKNEYFRLVGDSIFLFPALILL
jgi:hypothetical protein